MKVLSLFDGISCARAALDRAGIKVESYAASEIDPYAIAVSRARFPDIVRFGDVKSVVAYNPKKKLDLLIGGSPCQDLSIAKKNRKGLRGDSKLTPIECCRLQGLPDNHIGEGISDSQAYKCLGNAFNVDVIAHILSFIK